jgi:hypothetical protein
MKRFFKDKSLYDYPHLVAILIVLLFGRMLRIGSGAVVAAWYWKCMSKQYPWNQDGTGVPGKLKDVFSKAGIPRAQEPTSTRPD